jgi:hypothetical protein
MITSFKEHQVFELANDINPVVKKGMLGVILIKYDQKNFEVEFVKEDGSNYEYNGQSTFTINISDINLLVNLNLF